LPEAGIVLPETYLPKVFPPLNDTVKSDGNLNALITTSPAVPEVATVKSLLKLNSEVTGRTEVPLLRTPTVSEEPDVPLEPDVPEEPLEPEVPLEPEEPEVPEEPDVPLDPEEPDVPELPEEPDVPLIPEEPLVPEEPDDPDVPELPPVPPPPPVPLIASDQERFPDESITRTLVLELSCVTPLRSTCFIFILCDILD